MFPDGLGAMIACSRDVRSRRTKALANALATMPGQEAIAKAVADALAAFEAASAAHRDARGKAQAATRAGKAARAGFKDAYRLARATVFARLEDAKAADAFFPDLRRPAADVAPTPAATPAAEPGTPLPAQAA
jgi:hypothetical protein